VALLNSATIDGKNAAVSGQILPEFPQQHEFPLPRYGADFSNIPSNTLKNL
jgi:hypothetical protein